MCLLRASVFVAVLFYSPLLFAQGADPAVGAETQNTHAPLDDGIQQDYVLIDPPWWVYGLLLLAFVAFLVWTYLKKRWIRIGLIGTVVTGFFVIPGLHFKIEQIGSATGMELRLSDPDVPAVVLGCVAIIVLGLLEWPYSRADYEVLIHERAATRAGIMRTATRLVMQQHIGQGVDLDTIAATNNIAAADLYAALHCALEVQALLDQED